MTQDIGTFDLVGRGPYFYNDPPVRNVNLPNAGSIESEAFDWANTQGGIRLMVLMESALTVASGKKLTIQLLGDDREDGEFDTEIASRVTTGADSSGTALEIGDELLNVISMPEDLKYAKLKITTDDDMSEAVVTSRMAYIAR